VNRFGDELFPGPGFTEQKNGRLAAGDLPDETVNLAHRPAVADHARHHSAVV
jgi:hypothetical protein